MLILSIFSNVLMKFIIKCIAIWTVSLWTRSEKSLPVSLASKDMINLKRHSDRISLLKSNEKSKIKEMQRGFCTTELKYLLEYLEIFISPKLSSMSICTCITVKNLDIFFTVNWIKRIFIFICHRLLAFSHRRHFIFISIYFFII